MSTGFLLDEMRAGSAALLALAVILLFLCGRLALDAASGWLAERRSR